jgi:hypothetical protein
MAALFFPSAISLDDLRIDHRAAVGDGSNRAYELPEVVDPFLQEIGATSGAAFEQGDGIGRFAVLAQHDDADLRMRRPKPIGSLDPLIDPGRRHADVGEHDIGLLVLDRGQQRLEIAAGGHDLDLGVGCEQAPHPLANEIVVVGEHDSDRHNES